MEDGVQQEYGQQPQEQPQQPAQQQYQHQQQQYPNQQHRQYYGGGNPEIKHVRFCQIGVLLIIFGMIISIGVMGFAESEPASMYDPFPAPEEWVIQATTMGGIIYYAGLGLLLLGMLGLAFLTPGMHMHMKIALIIGFALVFGFGIGASSMMMLPYVF